MKKKYLSFLLSGAVTFCLLAPVATVPAVASRSEAEGTSRYKIVSSQGDVPKAVHEGKKAEYTVVNSFEENLISPDGQYVMKYIDRDEIDYVDSKNETIAKKQMPIYKSAQSEDFYNDCASDYGFLQLDNRINGADLQKAYIEMNNILKDAYFSQSNYDAEMVGKDEVYVAGTLDCAELCLNEEEIFEVFVTVKNDHPLLYFVSNTVFYNGSFLCLAIENEYAAASQRAAMNSKLKAMIESYDAKVASASSNQELVTLVHDDIISHAKYAFEADGVTPKNTNDVHNISGYISEEKELVCDGYTKTLGAILNYLDIETVFVGGWGVPQGAPTNDGAAHAWLLVKLGDGNYYVVDATWNDTNGVDEHKYLFIGNEIYNDHSTVVNGETGAVFVQYELPVLPEENSVEDTVLAKREDPNYIIKDIEITFEYKDGVLTFSGRGHLEGEEDCTLNPWYQYHDRVTKVVFDDRISYIGNFTLRGFEKLETIVWPKALTRIGQQAFELCSSLKTVSIPRNLAFLDGDIFSGCEQLENIEIGKTTRTFIFAENFIAGCPNLKSINVEDGHIVFKSIDGVMFCFDALMVYPSKREGSSYTIPDDVEKIGYGDSCPFWRCVNLESITMTDFVKDIKAGAFDECMNLKDIKLSNQLVHLWPYTFSKCKQLKRIEIPESVQSIGNGCFEYSGLEKISIGENVLELNMSAFSHCDSLIEIECKNYDIPCGGILDDPRNDLVLRGYEGSTLEEYAQMHNIKFEIINDFANSMCPLCIPPIVTDKCDVYHDLNKLTENTQIKLGDTIKISAKGNKELKLLINNKLVSVPKEGIEYQIKGYTVLNIIEQKSIFTREELVEAITNNKKVQYNLEADLVLTNWQMPIKYRESDNAIIGYQSFGGILMGNNHKLVFDGFSSENDLYMIAGLIGDNLGMIQDLNIVIDSVSNQHSTYSLCVSNYGTITGCNISVGCDTEIVAGGAELAGITRLNGGTISDCTVDININSSGHTYVSGLCKKNVGKILNSKITGKLKGENVYGISSRNETGAYIENTKVYADLEGEDVFGFGLNDGTIRYCEIYGNVKGTNTEFVMAPSSETGTIMLHCLYYDGDTFIKEEDVQYGNTIEFVLEKEGCLFEGWYDNKELQGKPVTTYSSIVNNKVYYAKWKENQQQGPDSNQTMDGQETEIIKPIDNNSTTSEARGDNNSDTEEINSYKITNSKKKEVAYKTTIVKKVKKLTIPSTVKLKGKTYKVTGIQSKAFKGCKNLKMIIIRTTKLTNKSVSAAAFKGLSKNVIIKVPKKKLKAYKKLFKKKGFKGTVKVIS